MNLIINAFSVKFKFIDVIQLVTIVFLSIAGKSYAQTTEQILPLDPAVRTGRLPNGFTYYIRHNEEPKNRVVMYLANKVGSILEDDDQQGLAHFVEHMSFNGTTHFPKNDLIDYLQKSGIRFGADLNAYTGFDQTVYQLPIPSDNPELLKSGIQILRDWAQEASLDPGKIDKERGVVLEEKRLRKGAGERMQMIYYPVILNNSRYAKRIPIGLETVLNGFKPAVLSRFYHDWYRPDLQAIIIVGDIDVKQIEKTVKSQFGTLKNPLNERERKNYTIPLTGRNQFISVTDKEATTTSLEIIMKHYSQPLKTATDYRNVLIRTLYNQMLGERYAELQRQPDPAFLSGGAVISALMANIESYSASIQAKPGELEKGVKAVWREAIRVKKFGFSVTEFKRAKTAYLNDMTTLMKEKDKTNSESYVNEYLAHFLKDEASPGIETEYQLVKKDLGEISLNELNSLSERYITSKDRDIIITAPEREKSSLPDQNTVNNWLAQVELEALQPYKDVVSSKPLLFAEPIAGRITTEKKDRQLNITTLTLNNGVKVILKPTDFRNAQVVFTAFARGGTSLYSDAQFQSAVHASRLVVAAGLGNYSRNELDKYLQGKQLVVNPYIDEHSQGILGSSATTDLKYALQMIYGYFTEPRKDTVAFNGIIDQSVAALTNRANDPKSVYADTVKSVLGSYSIRRTGPSLEKIRQVKLNNAYGIYKERFADASNFTFVFVGSIDTTAIRPLLEKYLGSLPSTYKKEEIKNLGIHIPEGKIIKTVYMGSEPKADVLLVYSGKFNYTPDNNVKMDALEEVLQIRLTQRLRQEESGVYSPSVSVNTSKLPDPRFGFYIHFVCSPDNAGMLVASAIDEISKLKTYGPPQENIDKWKAEQKTTFETRLKSNDFWLNYLTEQLMNDEPLNVYIDYNNRLNKVTTDDVKEIANKYLSGNNFIQLELLPKK